MPPPRRSLGPPPPAAPPTGEITGTSMLRGARQQRRGRGRGQRESSSTSSTSTSSSISTSISTRAPSSVDALQLAHPGGGARGRRHGGAGPQPEGPCLLRRSRRRLRLDDAPPMRPSLVRALVGSCVHQPTMSVSRCRGSSSSSSLSSSFLSSAGAAPRFCFCFCFCLFWRLARHGGATDVGHDTVQLLAREDHERTVRRAAQPARVAKDSSSPSPSFPLSHSPSSSLEESSFSERPPSPAAPGRERGSERWRRRRCCP